MHSGVSFAGLVTRVLTDRPPSRQRGRSEGVDRCDIATPGAREQFGVEQRSNRSFWTHSALPITDWGGCNLGQTTVTLLWRKIVARIPSPSPTLARSQRALTTGCRFALQRMVDRGRANEFGLCALYWEIRPLRIACLTDLGQAGSSDHDMLGKCDEVLKCFQASHLRGLHGFRFIVIDVLDVGNETPGGVRVTSSAAPPTTPPRSGVSADPASESAGPR